MPTIAVVERCRKQSLILFHTEPLGICTAQWETKRKSYCMVCRELVNMRICEYEYGVTLQLSTREYWEMDIHDTVNHKFIPICRMYQSKVWKHLFREGFSHSWNLLNQLQLYKGASPRKLFLKFSNRLINCRLLLQGSTWKLLAWGAIKVKTTCV